MKKFALKLLLTCFILIAADLYGSSSSFWDWKHLVGVFGLFFSIETYCHFKNKGSI